MRERRQKQVAEAVATQAVTGRKPVIEKLREQLLVFRQCDHAVANVPWRKDAEVASQASGASALVGNGDDGGQPGNPGLRPEWVDDPSEVALQTP
jgi:hypothetical protein